VSSRKPILVLIALMALIASTTAAVAFAAPAEIAFHPAPGEPHDYRVGMRVQVDGGKRSSSGQWLALQSVMRYRVNANGPALKMHVEPRFMQAENEERILLSSAQPSAPEYGPVARLMNTGFELTIARESGATQLEAGDRKAWQAIAEQTDVPLEQLGQLILAPAVVRNIPADKGAQVTIEHFHGMPALHLTVERVDRDSVTATIVRAADTAAATQAHSAHAGNTPVTSVHGRLRIDRSSGWIKAMTLISDRQVARAGRTERLHSVVTMRAVDDPATGSMYDSLQVFKTNAMQAALAGYDMYLPKTAADAPERPVIDTPENPLADAETAFHIDNEHGALVLDIRHHNGENIRIDQPTLDALTLRDANGKALDIGFVLESIGRDYDKKSTSRIHLLALDGHRAPLSDIAEVEATFTYLPVGAPTYVTLPLRDIATELEHGPAHAEALPIQNGWLVTLTGTYTTYYTYDNTAVFKGSSAITSDRPDNGMAPTDQALLDSVDDPDTWIQQYQIEGDVDAFALALYPAQGKATTHELTFTR